MPQIPRSRTRRPYWEDPRLNKRNIVTVAVVVICIFVTFAIVRSFILKPSDGTKVSPIPEDVLDSDVWGRHYPLQYESFQKNLEMLASPTGFGGSVSYQHSIRQPEILTNFKGMAFSKDYSEERGHPYALTDLMETKRITPQSPGACMTCKSSDLIDIYKDMGWGYAKTPLGELLEKIKTSITCASCHNPSTMDLTITNPAFTEAMQRRGIDVTKVGRDKMRSYVCAQCHVEYYFEPETTKVVLPWDKGLNPEEIYAYYAEKPRGFEGDWLHPDSQTIMLKAQHPEFEVFSSGIHAKAGISCADCHMPYVREKGKKYTSHWITSPMRHIDSSCRRCHPEELKWHLDRVKYIQKNVWELQRTAGTTIAKAHGALNRSLSIPGADKNDIHRAKEDLRKAQWYWDFIAAENSMGFHNPTLCLNILGKSIDLAHKTCESAGRAAGLRR